MWQGVGRIEEYKGGEVADRDTKGGAESHREVGHIRAKER